MITSELDGSILDSGSRSDLYAGAVVTLGYTGPPMATTYAWTLLATPVDENLAQSTAFLSSSTDPAPWFTVDIPGSYLVQLIMNAGTGTETIESVRLQYVTGWVSVRMPASGEFYNTEDPANSIPSDADLTGWADDINSSLVGLYGTLVSGVYFTEDSETTTNDSPTLLGIVQKFPNTPLEEDTPYRIRALVKGYNAAGPEFGVFDLTCMGYIVSGTASVGPAGVQNDFTDSPVGWSATIVSTGSNFGVQVTGVAATTIDWVVKIWVDK
jgi:hypothetical protein